MSLYLLLFWEFFKTGLLAVGGGLATLPFLSDMAERTGLFTQAQLADMVAVAESTPGPIGVNTATYVGFTAGGVPGAVVATLGLITPSYLIILLIATFLKRVQDNPFVDSVFRCLRPASTALITAAGLTIARGVFLRPGAGSLWGAVDWKGVVLAAVLLACTQFIPKLKKLHPLVWILCSALVGILLF